MGTYSFLDDYSEGCHPNILTALARTNLIQQTAYGRDEYSQQAKKLIRARLNDPNAHIYFIAGGTLANIIVTSAILRSHEAIIAAETGHILVHETGAIEAAGHKIISMPSTNGKLNAADIQVALDNHAHVPHMVKPRLVYISDATEIGTVYSKKEIQALHDICKEKELYLFLDGARLGSALCSDKNDLTLADLAQLTDIFSLGGAKNGALVGEAVIINNQLLNDDFEFHIKQRGGLLSKGRLLGIQFLELFRENLYFDLAAHANRMAKKMAKGIERKGHALAAETESNQIFAIFPDELIDRLSVDFTFYTWRRYDSDHSVVRLVTSWAAGEEMIEVFLEAI
jgi:threonine aldolase